MKGLTVYVPDELHLALKMAAANAKVTIREYVSEAIAAKIALKPTGVSDGNKPQSSIEKARDRAPQKSKAKRREEARK